MSPKISVGLRSLASNGQIRISDKGIGIPNEYLSKIFDGFFRVPKNELHNVKGHGLGLHYVMSILNKHDAKISVESIIDEGTIFNISIPKS